ncbi:hypothetical protein Y032_0105g3672 [Ancylostoma ceylanicum]|uniref:NR LBD domain-containing protein n=1 Tax=Ancylostoma ceylanicum TaxID=53326 RepID=A0A016TG72_9BILA|nr:hypothetical protein Y032_0105g3672 [Ancylostoma ceylanicum]
MQPEIETLLYKPHSGDCSPTDDHKYKRWDLPLRERISRKNTLAQNAAFLGSEELGFRPSGMKTKRENGEDVLIQMSTKSVEKVQLLPSYDNSKSNLAKGAEDSFQDIDETRQKVLESFERHVRHISPLRDSPRRFSNLLLLLPPMLNIARDLIEDVQLAKLFGLASIDRLMQELLLPPDSSTIVDKTP